MDILNTLPDDRFEEIDDLLAFISIYDDEERTRGWREMLRRHRDSIEGKVVLEAGCGLGLFAEEMAELGARRVYAVEVNPHLHALASERLGARPSVVMVEGDVRSFDPPEPVDLLVHDFFGPLLYDEDLYALERLRFSPALVLPDRALLRWGLAREEDLCDDVVTPAVLRRLEGVLVSGLFDDEARLSFHGTAAEWSHPGGLRVARCDLDGAGRPTDVLYFGLEIWDGRHLVGRSGCSSNWSYVFTPRAGERFELAFEWNGRSMEAVFGWSGTGRQG